MEAGMISVDKWSSGSQAYFLTHLHADHTVGLSSGWSRGQLFCSRITAKIFPCKFPGFDLSLLRVVEIGNWYELSLISPSTGTPTTVRFKAIDAHHCPGSVMYLFRGDFGCMLFTGDFRWESNGNTAETGMASLLDSLRDEKLDILYIDNTYCNPKYLFPSRDVAAKQVVDIINAHPLHDVIIAIDSLGKEDLLLYISQTLSIKIWVWPERLQIMHLLGFYKNFTTQTSLTRVRAVPRYSFSIDTLEGLNAHRPTIGIMPSGLPWATKDMEENGVVFGSSPSTSRSNKKIGTKDTPSLSKDPDFGGNPMSVRRYHEHIYVVPYSNHSCFSEIQEFIQLLQPLNIKGIVSSSSCYIDPSYHLGHLLRDRQDSPITNKLKQETESKPAKSAAGGRKRKLLDFLGVRASRVNLLRRLSHGARVTGEFNVVKQVNLLNILEKIQNDTLPFVVTGNGLV